jgi:hypothetical protein
MSNPVKEIILNQIEKIKERKMMKVMIHLLVDIELPSFKLTTVVILQY